VRPGDILVLVGARDRLASGIIQGLKERGIEVAGADRLTLGDDLAVQDLMALMKVSTMPSDDLSLAALLRSPLCGLSEEDLFELTHGRSGTLRRALSEAPDHVEAADFLNDMARHADFERPYEFLERALVGHDGRRKLLARLGVEAEDSIDELLVQSLIFEMCETPSLAGFVAWLEGGEITVKREMDRGVDAVRVMTVHGAKGLEAPVVILPDTIVAGRPGGTRPAVLTVEGADNKPDLLVWAGRKVDDDAVARAAREAAEARALAERRRLLYVALTRAEDWLILCGANARVKARDDSWYPMLTAGMERLAEAGATLRDLPSPTGEGEMQRFETGAGAEELPPDGEIADAACERPLPAWLVPAPRETRTDRGSPSDLDDGPGSAHSGKGRDPELARQRGNAIHLALERLPNVAAAERGRAGEEMLARAFPGLDPESRAEALAEVGRVLAMPEAGRIFGPESFAEVAVAIDPPVGGPRMIGRIDRLAPGPDEVLIVDIKTDSRPPDRAEDVQDAYLAQLGAYAAAVAPAWPGRRIALAILWTAAPALMPIDPDAAARAFKSASFGRTARS